MYIDQNKTLHKRKYVFCNTVLEEVVSASYLELTFNNKLKFSEHVSNIASKTTKVLGMARRKSGTVPRMSDKVCILRSYALNWNMHVQHGIHITKKT